MNTTVLFKILINFICLYAQCVLGKPGFQFWVVVLELNNKAHPHQQCSTLGGLGKKWNRPFLPYLVTFSQTGSDPADQIGMVKLAATYSAVADEPFPIYDVGCG